MSLKENKKRNFEIEETRPLANRDGMFKDLAGVLFLIVAFAGFFYPMIFEGKTFFFRDVLYFAYPMKLLIWQGFHEGVLPFWWPNIFSGVPFYALLQPGVFYPFSLFLLLDDFSTAFNLFLLGQYFFLVVSVYGLCRYWGISVYGALLSALVAFLGGYFLSLSSVHNHFQSAIWLPSIILFFDRFLRTGKARWFVGAWLCQASQILGGSPENCILTVFILFGYVLIAQEHSRFKAGGKILALAAVVGLALVVTMIQLLPTYLLMDKTVRGTGMTYENITLWSLTSRGAASMILPASQEVSMGGRGTQLSWFLPSFYMGVIPLLFMVSGFYLLRRRQTLFWIVIFWAGILLAMGKYNPLFQVLYEWVPLFNVFRYPEKFMFMSAFSLVFVAGYGLDGLIHWIEKKALGVRTLLVMICGMALLILLGWYWRPDVNPANQLALLALVGISSWALLKERLSPRGFGLLMLVIVAVDLILRNATLAPMIGNDFYEKPPALYSRIAEQGESSRLYSGPLDGKQLNTKNIFPRERDLFFNHAAVREQLYPNLGFVYGLNYVDGLTGLELSHTKLWSDVFTNSPMDKRFRILKRSNVGIWITDEYAVEPSMANLLGMKKVEFFQDALPRAFLVARVQLGKEPYLLNTYYEEDFDPLSVVMVGEPVPLEETKNFTGEVDSVEYAPNHVVVHSRQNGEGILVLLDSYFPGWTATVDGKPASIFRANHFYRGVKLEAGEHTVEFSFVPEGFWQGAMVTAIVLVLMSGLLLTPGCRKKLFPSP